MFLIAFLLLVILSYILFDINFHFKGFAAYFCAKYLRSTLKFTQPSIIYGICFTTDIDVNLKHMNNTKFLREFEFGRLDFCVRAGLVRMRSGFKNGTKFVIAGTILRYLKSVLLLTPYKKNEEILVVTSVVWWDNRTFYMEQKMISLTDKVVRAVGYTKFTFRDAETLEKFVHNLERPNITPDLKAYIEANESLEFINQRTLLEKNLDSD